VATNTHSLSGAVANGDTMLILDTSRETGPDDRGGVADLSRAKKPPRRAMQYANALEVAAEGMAVARNVSKCVFLSN
jgi:hypothetical protein